MEPEGRRRGPIRLGLPLDVSGSHDVHDTAMRVAAVAWRRAAGHATSMGRFHGTVGARGTAKLAKDDFLDGTSAGYLEQLEKQWEGGESGVEGSWAAFLRQLERGAKPNELAEAHAQLQNAPKTAPTVQPQANAEHLVDRSLRLFMLLRAYQVRGHYLANLDPLGLAKHPLPGELDPSAYGFTKEDMKKEIYLGKVNGKGIFGQDEVSMTLEKWLQLARQSYCGKIGYEYMHIAEREQCDWLREKIEKIKPYNFDNNAKVMLYDRLAWATMFEHFLSNKFTAAKRFGLEGAETLIPGMKSLIDKAAALGVDDIVFGMPHRGRLNVLANVVRKPLEAIFAEFHTGIKPSSEEGVYTGTGDVKYHLGTSYDRPTHSGRRVHLSLLANPSHLEAVDPVVVGKVRAKQYYGNDVDKSKKMSILLHGDGSFAGQGVVYETFDMSALPDYEVGGTIHIVVNNQVAFTTDPYESRSSAHCTEVAKTVSAPIFHVNGDDAEAVAHVMELAAEYRQRWKKDVVIDLVCYRKYGHNEIDEPTFTQPLMYEAIKRHKTALELYRDRLLGEGVLTKKDFKDIDKRVENLLNEGYEAGKDYVPKERDWLASHWKAFKSPEQLSRIRNTGVPMDALKEVGQAICKIPENLNVHKAIRRVYQNRQKMVDGEEGVDWGMAEALAFGTLLKEGNHVRLSGQDCERGTFSHRHAVLHDQKNGQRYVPLSNLFDGQPPGFFTVSNSSLSEFGILGFELGYSMENPNSLVLWEAQFGDFANTAQVIFDQFLSAGEAKWLRQTGLVVLLPHGYDGQGPEHSSARMERFLQMSDEDPEDIPDIDESQWFKGGHLGGQIQKSNWQICNVTTPSNYFHMLRRQIHREFRKPLVVFSPKNLLRHPKAKSPITEFDDVDEAGEVIGIRFKRLIMDKSQTDRSPYPPVEEGVKRLVLCSGKIYYELDAEREARGLEDVVHICRIEQLAPFPFDLLKREMRRYPNAEIIWCQEEPKNMGAYWHVVPRFHSCQEFLGLPSTTLRYAGRKTSAATATGFSEIHAQEQKQILLDAFEGF